MERNKPNRLPFALAAVLVAALGGACLSCQTGQARPDAPAEAAPQVAQSAAPDLAGDWMGKLDIGVSIRLVFRIALDPESPGGYRGVCISPDQSPAEFPISALSFDGSAVSIAVASIGARYRGSFRSDGMIEGSFIQGAASLPLVLERVEWKSATRPQEPTGPFHYRNEEVTIAAGGFTLGGTLSLPKGRQLADALGRLPALVLITGSGLQNRDEEILGHKPFLLIADHLSRAGFAVLRLDDRGVGASGGDPSAATTEDFARDISAAVDYLKTRPELDQSRLGLCGHSEGGLIAFMLAAKRPDDIAFIVSLAGPGMKGADILLLQGRLIAEAEGVPEPDIERNADLQKRLLDLAAQAGSEADHEAIAAQARAILSEADLADSDIEAAVAEILSPWMRWFVSCDPAIYLERVRCPVLALNGELDLQVPAAQNLTIIKDSLARAGNAHAVVTALTGLNHLFQHATTGSPGEYGSIEETFAPEALETITEWLKRTVSP